MRREHKLTVSLFLSAALMAPVGALAVPRPQDEHERHEQEEHQRRAYDQQYRDYHNWDSREDRAYRQWLAERNRDYVDYDQLRAGTSGITGNGVTSRRSASGTKSTTNMSTNTTKACLP